MLLGQVRGEGGSNTEGFNVRSFHKINAVNGVTIGAASMPGKDVRSKTTEEGAALTW
jgi:hypothetical protein